jgi:hypothetical protein
MKVIAVKAIHYGGKEYSPGEQLEISDKDARVLVAVESVKLTDATPGTDKPEPEPKQNPDAGKHERHRDMTPEAPGLDDDNPEKGKPHKGHYQRRDMTPDDDGA